MNYDDECASIINLGYGQGRDALFIARKGRSVLGVDKAQTGIEQMLEEAESEKLAVVGVMLILRIMKRLICTIS